jgi:hypothetical protein
MGFELTDTLLSRLSVDWPALGIQNAQRQELIGIYLRTLQSFALDPGRNGPAADFARSSGIGWRLGSRATGEKRQKQSDTCRRRSIMIPTGVGRERVVRSREEVSKTLVGGGAAWFLRAWAVRPIGRSSSRKLGGSWPAGCATSTPDGPAPRLLVDHASVAYWPHILTTLRDAARPSVAGGALVEGGVDRGQPPRDYGAKPCGCGRPGWDVGFTDIAVG